jgi:hypothetical protein
MIGLLIDLLTTGVGKQGTLANTYIFFTSGIIAPARTLAYIFFTSGIIPHALTQ